MTVAVATPVLSHNNRAHVSIKLGVCCGVPACSSTVEVLVSRLAEGSGNLKRERERLCLGYFESHQNPGP